MGPFESRTPLRRKLLLLVSISTATLAVALLLRALTIELILVVWNVAAIVAIVMTESDDAKRGFAGSFTDDERWSSIKARLERIEAVLGKAKSEADVVRLEKEKAWLETELRRVQWSLSESELSARWNAANGKLESLAGTAGGMRSSRVSEEEILRELKEILKCAGDAIGNEPAESLPLVLRPLLNQVKALYNSLRHVSRHSLLLSDLWVSWALLSSAVNGVAPASGITRYSGKAIRKDLEHLLAAMEGSTRLRSRKEPELR